MTASRPQQRRKPNALVKIGVFIGLPAVGFGLIYGLNFLTAPWSVSLPGKPALTGYWQGEISFKSGDDRRFVLHLSGTPNECGNCLGIHGAAKVCSSERNVSYDISGDPRNYRGTRFWVSAGTERRKPGIYLDKIEGEWSGDLLRMHTDLTVVDADGTISSDHQIADPPLFEMQRASEAVFKAAC